jgi:hypothetical protein
MVGAAAVHLTDRLYLSDSRCFKIPAAARRLVCPPQSDLWRASVFIGSCFE